MAKAAALRLPYAPIKMLACIGVALAVLYVALIALVMNYAALTVSFAQSIRNDEAAIARLEQAYFSELDALSRADYRALGYAKPVAHAFVTGAPATALR